MAELVMPTGWLSPTGDLWKCEYYEHTATAEEICKKLNVAAERTWLGEEQALFSLGWCKLAISSFGSKKYWVHWERPLTDYQRNFLKEYFEREKELIFQIDVTSLCKFFNEDDFFEWERRVKDGK